MERPILYVKTGCPWCVDALAYFESKEVNLEIVDVRADPNRMDELVATRTFFIGILVDLVATLGDVRVGIGRALGPAMAAWLLATYHFDSFHYWACPGRSRPALGPASMAG